ALAARLAAAGPEARDALEAELAALLTDDLGRPEVARPHWARLAAEAADRALAAHAGARLEAVLERIGDFAGLCERLEARAEASDATEAWRLHARIAELAEGRLGDAARARRHLELALALAPEQALLWRRLAGLCDEAGQPAELLRAIEGELASLESDEGAAGDPPTRARRLGLHLQAARLVEQHLGDAARAERHWRRVRELDPDDPEASERLLARAAEAERHDEVAELLRQRLAAPALRGDPARDTDLRLRLAAVLAGPLGRTDEAIEVLEAAPARADEPG